jgi:hypothetical protein
VQIKRYHANNGQPDEKHVSRLPIVRVFHVLSLEQVENGLEIVHFVWQILHNLLEAAHFGQRVHIFECFMDYLLVFRAIRVRFHVRFDQIDELFEYFGQARINQVRLFLIAIDYVQELFERFFFFSQHFDVRWQLGNETFDNFELFKLVEVSSLIWTFVISQIVVKFC